MLSRGRRRCPSGLAIKVRRDPGEVGDMGAGRMFPARDLDGNYIQVYHLNPQVRDMQHRTV